MFNKHTFLSHLKNKIIVIQGFINKTYMSMTIETFQINVHNFKHKGTNNHILKTAIIPV